MEPMSRYYNTYYRESKPRSGVIQAQLVPHVPAFSARSVEVFNLAVGVLAIVRGCVGRSALNADRIFVVFSHATHVNKKNK